MRLALPLLVLAACAGCARRGTTQASPWSPSPVDDLGPIVAQVGPVPVRAHEVEAEMIRTGASARQALDALISLHLLAETARGKLGFAPPWLSDPELKSALAQRIVDREIQPKLRQEQVPEAELKAIYQKAIKIFVHPRLVDISVLAVFTGARMKKEPRLKRAETAHDLAAYLATKTISGPQDFEAIAKEPAWQSRKVGYMRVLQSDDQPLPLKVGEAAAKLKAPGDTTGLIEDEVGFFFATYAGEKPPENVTFAQARTSLLQGYYERWRQAQLDELIKKLGEGHRIEAHPQFLR